MSESTTPKDEPPIRLDYRGPVRDRPKSFFNNPPKLVGLVIVALIPIFVLAFIVLTSGHSTHESNRARCSSNLKNIAAACITYSNTHNGAYPGDFVDMMTSTGMSYSEVFVCPDSTDTPATGPTLAQQSAALTAGGHLSYIWLGKGVTTDSPADTVLVYEPLSNHNQKGMNVLFNDYHVQWLPAADAQKMINSIVPGKPTVWPPPPASQP